jgi:transcriptional regulator with XRE-family HTH domain
MEQIVSKLKERRLERGLTITQLAQQMGMERSRLSELECGKRSPSLKRLNIWAGALGLKVTIKFE